MVMILHLVLTDRVNYVMNAIIFLIHHSMELDILYRFKFHEKPKISFSEPCIQLGYFYV